MPDNDVFLEANVKATYDSYSKFEFYLIGLTFTLLALSVQTTNLGNSIWPDILELSSWLLIVASGIIGLRNVRNMSNIYALGAEKEKTRRSIQNLHSFEKDGSDYVLAPDPFDETSAEFVAHPTKRMRQILEIKYKSAGTVMNERQSSQDRWRKIQHVLFVIGLLVMMAAKAFCPIGALI